MNPGIFSVMRRLEHGGSEVGARFSLCPAYLSFYEFIFLWIQARASSIALTLQRRRKMRFSLWTFIIMQRGGWTQKLLYWRIFSFFHRQQLYAFKCKRSFEHCATTRKTTRDFSTRPTIAQGRQWSFVCCVNSLDSSCVWAKTTKSKVSFHPVELKLQLRNRERWKKTRTLKSFIPLRSVCDVSSVCSPLNYKTSQCSMLNSSVIFPFQSSTIETRNIRGEMKKLTTKLLKWWHKNNIFWLFCWCWWWCCFEERERRQRGGDEEVSLFNFASIIRLSFIPPRFLAELYANTPRIPTQFISESFSI